MPSNKFNFGLLPLLGGLCVLVAACGDDSAGTVDTTDTSEPYDVGPWPDAGGWDLGELGTDAVEVDACDAVASAILVRQRSVPGGRQLHFLLEDADGNALDGAFASCLSIEAADIGPLPVAWTRVESAPGATLLVVSADSADAADAAAIAEQLVALRPDGERVAIWRWSNTLTQVVGATVDHGRLLRRIATDFASSDAAPLPVVDTRAAALEEWGDYDWHAMLGVRNAVFVAPSAQIPELDAHGERVRDLWVVGEAPGALRTFDGSTDPADLAAEVSAELDATAAAGLGLLGFCDPGTALELTLKVGDRAIGTYSLGDAATEHVRASCSAPEALAAAPAEMPVVELTFTADERRVYDGYHAANNENDFTGSFRIEPETVPVAMVASFRGQSSGACERKNFSINLEGSDARHVIAGTGTDEFDLISMCLDDRYVNQTNTDALFAQLDLWRLAFGLVELRIDSQSAGIYLYIEDLGEEVTREVSRARAVVRRRTDIDNKPAEVKWSFDDDDAAALQRYNAFVQSAQTLTGDELVDFLDSSMDLDQYLRWMALMSLLRNGDYIDEVYFIGEETVGADGTPRDFYFIQTWDPDDIFSDCHHSGRFALTDDNGLLYCAEALIDHAIFDEPAIYARYVDVLDELIAELTVERFTAQAMATRDRLVAFLEDSEVRGAMVELLAANPAATDRDVAAGEIATATDELVAGFGARRDELLSRIAAWREANP
jgi:hypothetical protein